MKKVTAAVCAVVLAGVLVSGAVLAKGANDRKQAIGSQSALEIALADAGILQADAVHTRSVLEREGMHYVYDVEFDCAGYEYDYTVDAKSGDILEREVEPNRASAAPQTTSAETTGTETTERVSVYETQAQTAVQTTAQSVTLEQAKRIAAADAKLDAKQVTFTEAELDEEDGVRVYEVEFLHNGTAYEYHIGITGEILRRQTEGIYARGEKQENTAAASAGISVEQAKEIALRHANLRQEDVRLKKALLDRDDNAYEIEFVCARTQYEYSVDVQTGKILEYDIDND